MGRNLLAHGLPESEGRRIQELARSYAREVVYEEWKMMARSEESPTACAILDDMRGRILALDPATESQKLLYRHKLQRIHELSDTWQERLLQAASGLPAILWAVLLICGFIVVACTYLFGLQSTLVHTLMVAALALTTGLVLFTVGALAYPFKGDPWVRPDAFLFVLERFERGTFSDL